MKIFILPSMSKQFSLAPDTFPQRGDQPAADASNSNASAFEPFIY